MIKACWFCEYFYYSNHEPDWSEVTPGSAFMIACRKNHWDFDAEKTSQDEFGKILSMAESCKDYKQRDA